MNQFTKWTMGTALAFTVCAPVMTQTATEAVAASKQATVKVSAASIYKTPSKKVKYGVVKKGTKLTYTSKGAIWTKVKYKGKTGYILTKQLSYISSQTALYLEYDKYGKQLKEAQKVLHTWEKEGKVKDIYAEGYIVFQDAVADVDAEIGDSKLTKANKAKLRAKYIQPAEIELQRLGGIYNMWNLYTQTEKRMNNFDYTSAQKSYDQSITTLAETEAYILEKKLQPIQPKMKEVLKKRQATLERRFSYSTLKEMGGSLSNDVRYLQGNERDTYLKKHTNGVITTDFENSLFFVNIGNSIRTGEFKKLTFTLAAGEYWNTHTSENDYLAKVFIKYDDDNAAILTEGSEPMQVTIYLERYKYFKQIELKGSIHRDIIISNVRFWR
ncbi:hypothetical protein [Kurthia gibsonii]|uniref:hypothetical protein n=1 Tax=Kurthia gibsonii TaxID=33946 RepID=UPI002DB7F01E|nr:hypothetical protein [Kurthia gibsonii]MEB7773232.1 hypothetical protein [Kurthia gibsonii]